MPFISGTCFLIASSTPAFNVIGDIGHVSQEPSNSKLTMFLLSIDMTFISPPSAINMALFHLSLTQLYQLNFFHSYCKNNII